GYYQLMSSVDKFIIYDDVSYIKNGWINRNRILVNGNAHYFTVPVIGGSCNNKINTVKIDKTKKKAINKIIITIEQAYKKSVFFDEVFPVIYGVLSKEYDFISDLAITSLLSIKNKLDIGAEVVLTSTNYGNNNLTSQDRVIDINVKEHASTYINSEGGRLLYDKKTFKLNGVNLKFIHPEILPYKQLCNGEFVPSLSIIDVVMNNGWDTTKQLVNSFELKD
ncbi:WbqC family protein, partial [Escherichia coli]|nr:WbqC family protein [Escherichia coli]EGH5362469.1 WbqC family protein [Escherichia coli]